MGEIRCIKWGNQNQSTQTVYLVYLVQELTEHEVISTTYKLVQSSSSRYLCDLITVQPSQSSLSSALVSLHQPSVHSSLNIINCSFQHAAPHLWNKLPPILFMFLISMMQPRVGSGAVRTGPTPFPDRR